MRLGTSARSSIQDPVSSRFVFYGTSCLPSVAVNQVVICQAAELFRCSPFNLLAVAVVLNNISEGPPPCPFPSYTGSSQVWPAAVSVGGASFLPLCGGELLSSPSPRPFPSPPLPSPLSLPPSFLPSPSLTPFLSFPLPLHCEQVLKASANPLVGTFCAA